MRRGASAKDVERGRASGIRLHDLPPGRSSAGIPSRACLRLAELAQIELFISDAVIDEVSDVLTRPKIRAKFPSLTPERVGGFLSVIAQLATTIASPDEMFRLPRDLKDEKYLNLAASAAAVFLISRDKDLLELSLPENPASAAIFQRCPDLKIVTPESFLRLFAPTEPFSSESRTQP